MTEWEDAEPPECVVNDTKAVSRQSSVLILPRSLFKQMSGTWNSG